MEQKMNQIALFIRKTFQILQNEEFKSIVDWTEDQKRFSIKNIQQFEKIVLPKYFRHNNMNSFVRQLNMYGFHKCRKDPTKYVFFHESFSKGQPSLLVKIQRKIKADDRAKQNEKIDYEHPSPKTTKCQISEAMNSSLFTNSSQNNVSLKQSQKNQQRIKSACSIQQDVIDSIPKIEEIQMSDRHFSPFRSLIEKSYIFDQKRSFNNMNMKVDQNGWNSIELLQCYDEKENMQEQNDNTSIIGDIQEERKMFNERVNEAEQIKTFNFLNDLIL